MSETLTEERYDAPLNVVVTARQKEWLERAAKDRQTSVSAITRAAVETYRRLHPTLGDDK